jgi:hypothetical protein
MLQQPRAPFWLAAIALLLLAYTRSCDAVHNTARVTCGVQDDFNEYGSGS